MHSRYWRVLGSPSHGLFRLLLSGTRIEDYNAAIFCRDCQMARRGRPREICDRRVEPGCHVRIVALAWLPDGNPALRAAGGKQWAIALIAHGTQWKAMVLQCLRLSSGRTFAGAIPNRNLRAASSGKIL